MLPYTDSASEQLEIRMLMLFKSALTSSDFNIHPLSVIERDGGVAQINRSVWRIPAHASSAVMIYKEDMMLWCLRGICRSRLCIRKG